MLLLRWVRLLFMLLVFVLHGFDFEVQVGLNTGFSSHPLRQRWKFEQVVVIAGFGSAGTGGAGEIGGEELSILLGS